MDDLITLGTDRTNSIILSDKKNAPFHCEIRSKGGSWILTNLAPNSPIKINGKKRQSPIILEKYDKIEIGKDVIRWANHLYEGEDQDLFFEDIFSYYGRISRANFRALTLFGIGVCIVILFLPGLISSTPKGQQTVERVENIQFIAPLIYLVGYSSVFLLFLILAVKRMRDTRNPIWKILIPIVNIKILYFDKSKK